MALFVEGCSSQGAERSPGGTASREQSGQPHAPPASACRRADLLMPLHALLPISLSCTAIILSPSTSLTDAESSSDGSCPPAWMERLPARRSMCALLEKSPLAFLRGAHVHAHLNDPCKHASTALQRRAATQLVEAHHALQSRMFAAHSMCDRGSDPLGAAARWGRGGGLALQALEGSQAGLQRCAIAPRFQFCVLSVAQAACATPLHPPPPAVPPARAAPHLAPHAPPPFKRQAQLHRQARPRRCAPASFRRGAGTIGRWRGTETALRPCPAPPSPSTCAGRLTTPRAMASVTTPPPSRCEPALAGVGKAAAPAHRSPPQPLPPPSFAARHRRRQRQPHWRRRLLPRWHLRAAGPHRNQADQCRAPWRGGERRRRLATRNTASGCPAPFMGCPLCRACCCRWKRQRFTSLCRSATCSKTPGPWTRTAK